MYKSKNKCKTFLTRTCTIVYILSYTRILIEQSRMRSGYNNGSFENMLKGLTMKDKPERHKSDINNCEMETRVSFFKKYMTMNSAQQHLST